MREIVLTRAIGKLEAYLAERDLEMKAHSDFKKFEKVAKSVRSSPISAEFGGGKFDYHSETGFWTAVWNNSTPISIHATRYENIGNLSLSKHIKTQHPRIYNGTFKTGCPFMKKMKGHICYSGELEIARDWAGKDLVGAIVLMNFMLAFLRWRNLNWVWGLMDGNLALRGMAANMGFAYAIPNGVTWQEPPKNISSSDWLVASTADDIQHWATVIAERGPAPLLRRQRN